MNTVAYITLYFYCITVYELNFAPLLKEVERTFLLHTPGQVVILI